MKSSKRPSTSMSEGHTPTSSSVSRTPYGGNRRRFHRSRRRQRHLPLVGADLFRPLGQQHVRLPVPVHDLKSSPPRVAGSSLDRARSVGGESLPGSSLNAAKSSRFEAHLIEVSTMNIVDDDRREFRDFKTVHRFRPRSSKASTSTIRSVAKDTRLRRRMN